MHAGTVMVLVALAVVLAVVAAATASVMLSWKGRYHALSHELDGVVVELDYETHAMLRMSVRQLLLARRMHGRLVERVGPWTISLTVKSDRRPG